MRSALELGSYADLGYPDLPQEALERLAYVMFILIGKLCDDQIL